MKKLLIIRHSKSGWDSSIESDYERIIKKGKLVYFNVPKNNK